MFTKYVGIAVFILILVGAGLYLGQKYNLIPANTPPAGSGIITPAPTYSPMQVITITQTPTKTVVIATPTPDDKAAVIAMVKASEVARVGASANASEYTISLIQGNYAKGMASASGGGAIWFAEKVGGTWKLVFIGNGTVQCSDLTSFPDFPKTMIPECWDGATQKLVTR